MKILPMAGAFAALTVAAASAHAQSANIRGSDTLFGAVTDAITTLHLESFLHYTGGGSGTGESALIAGTQGIAPMSRALNTAAIVALLNQGVTPVQNVIGLDGVSLFVNKSGNAATGIDIPTIRNIYLCNITDWSGVPGSGLTGPIKVYARNGLSGTTDTFKTLVGGLPATTNGNANWPACVTEVDTTDDIANHTINENDAIGFAGGSAGRAANKALAVAVNATSPAIPPSEETIRDFSYPLARRLYVNAVADGRFPSDDEQALLDAVLDRSFMDPILARNEFITCPPVEDGGCP